MSAAPALFRPVERKSEATHQAFSILAFNLLFALFGHMSNATCSQGAEGSRFIINNDTVLDKNTGHLWRRCSIGTIFDKKRNRCNGKPMRMTFAQSTNLSNHVLRNGMWRVPTKNEFVTLLSYEKNTLFIDSCVFPEANRRSAEYWTADMFDSKVAWSAYFGRFDAESYSSNNTGHYGKKLSVRLVHVAN